MTGTLFVVATPIGNLEDITLRALRVLREVNVIAAEDTRRTARLLNHYGIKTPCLSFHEHNSRSRLPLLLGRLAQGDQVAIVTDAGTPSVSDPGVELVHACVAAGIAIDPIPGASAPLTAAIASGFPLAPWTIFGFPPNRSKTRETWLQEVSEIPHTVSFFEAPHRIRATLAAASRILGERQIVIGRELTKVHQEFLRGTAATIAELLETPRGEFTVVVGPALMDKEGPVPGTDDEIVDMFRQIAEKGGVKRRTAIVTVAKKFRRSPREVYAAVERLKE